MTAGRSRLVLMTADTIGGVWTYALELIAALRPLGVEVALATMGAPLRPAQVRALAGLRHLALFESEYALEWMTDPWDDVDEAGAWLRELAARVRPDVVHVNGYAHAALPFGVPAVVVAHSCVCSWHRAVRGSDAGPEWDEYRRRAAAGLRAAAAVVAPTAAILREILDALEVDLPGRVIPNGRRLDVREVPKEPFVLAAGRLWDEAKGLADLEACAARVSWPIRVAGALALPGLDAAPRPRTPSQPPVPSLPPALERLGELDPAALAARMARASIYAHPARYEPFGLAIVEAALAGCALVLADLPSLREVWGGDACYVPPRDPDALAAMIETLITDPLRRAALAERARSRARALTPARMAAAYGALYAELVEPAREVCA